MTTSPRFRRGDISPLRPGLLFFRYNRGAEIWVTPERFEKERAGKKVIQARRRKKPECKKYQRDYFRSYNNLPKQKKYHSDFYKQPHVRARMSARARERRATDVQYSVTIRLRNRIGRVLRGRGIQKAALTELLVGCSVREFREYFEKKFTEGMTWQRFINGEIVIDHVLPLSLFDLSDNRQQFAAFNFRNLQPMWKLENISKSDKLPDGTRGRDARSIIPFREVA